MKHNFYSKRIISSSIGYLEVTCSDEGLTEINIHKKAPKQTFYEQAKHKKLLDKAKRELLEYLNQQRRSFDLPLSPAGTNFQRAAWQALCNIPYGQKISYSEQAKMMGQAKKFRAVGGANGKNPLPIIIPCHRVIAKDGTLGGYSGGLEIKESLLKLESAL